MIRRKHINPLPVFVLGLWCGHTYLYQVSSGDLLCVSFISIREFHLKCSEEELIYNVKALHICWERLTVGGERDNRRWDGWMASPTQWTWIRVNSRSWWWTGRPGMLQSTGSQRVGHDWVTELNWTDRYSKILWKIFGSYANEIFNNWFWRLCHSGLIWVFLPNFCSLVLSQKKCDLILRR